MLNSSNSEMASAPNNNKGVIQGKKKKRQPLASASIYAHLASALSSGLFADIRLSFPIATAGAATSAATINTTTTTTTGAISSGHSSSTASEEEEMVVVVGHRVVLSQAPLLLQLFSAHPTAQALRIEWPSGTRQDQFEGKHVHALVQFLYTGHPTALPPCDNVRDLVAMLELAHLFQLQAVTQHYVHVSSDCSAWNDQDALFLMAYLDSHLHSFFASSSARAHLTTLLRSFLLARLTTTTPLSSTDDTARLWTLLPFNYFKDIVESPWSSSTTTTTTTTSSVTELNKYRFIKTIIELRNHHHMAHFKQQQQHTQHHHQPLKRIEESVVILFERGHGCVAVTQTLSSSPPPSTPATSTTTSTTTTQLHHPWLHSKKSYVKHI